ncbi:hypothetical protein [Acinetobacter junii]|uniref:hypothetical protein n=1 Tax=Acinetobacter junii TaxID=40215 RepID=UPI0018FFF530|nr:hypothetical protein [Acinetobacter junii]MBJ8440050.1 hypothetical protein [Acinetobacter junii]
MRSELFKTALQGYKDELAKCLQEGGEGKRVAAFLEKIDHQIPLSQHMFDVAWNHRQSEVDELQNRNKMLSNNVAEQGKKLVYQNEIIETQACKLLGLREEKDELQKRLDAAIYLLPSFKAENDLWGCDQVERQIELLEQALKGGGE